MKTTQFLTLVAGSALMIGAFAASATAATQTHLDVSFSDYALGTLPVNSSTSIWSKSGNTESIIERVDGSNRLHLNGDGGNGSLVVNTANALVPSLILSEGTKVQWQMDFQIPATAFSSETVFFRLNTGGAGDGKYFAGFAIKDGNFARLLYPNGAATTATTFGNVSGLTLSAGSWYTVTIDVTVNSINSVEYGISLVQTANPANLLYSDTVSLAPNKLSFDDAVRLTMSTTGTTDIFLDNIRLSSGSNIPESGSVGLVIGLAVVSVIGGRKLLRRR